ncbi:HupE/UreJ family protein [Shewanella piezotolerans]|uniref:HupE/UreJ family protein n=1 Tax=Shewanella piezotolerans TaxID=404011 RepID=UPI00224D4190|nr:HupE/UreJ family protein [Shewanella piezotolerans]
MLLGFICGTSAIHVAGVILGIAMQDKDPRNRFVRSSGGVIAVVGGYLLLSV